jgi:PAS domain S-box-containing protein
VLAGIQEGFCVFSEWRRGRALAESARTIFLVSVCVVTMLEWSFSEQCFVMIDFFKRLFDSEFTPHGQAYLMRPEIIWLHVVSDALIALAYFSILITLACFLRKRDDLSHRGIFFLLGFFVLACGVAHLMEIWSVWHGTFRLVGFVKAVTGVSAVATAIMLVKVFPQALALTSPEGLKRVSLALESERTEHERERSSWSVTRDELTRQIDKRAAESRAASEELAGELAARNRLHELGLRLLAAPELRPLQEEVVTGIIALQDGQLGTLQLSNPETGTLEVVANRGFQQDVLENFRSLSGSNTAWDSTLRRGECVVIEDVLADPSFEPHWPVAASAGFRAMQFTPLIDRNGDLLGILSTHFRQPHRFTERDVRLSLLYARQAAEMIEHKRAGMALTESVRHVRQLVSGLSEYAIFMLDPAGRFVTWNEGAERIVGFDAQEMIGKHFSVVFEPHELELEKPGEAMRLAVAEGRFEDLALRARKDGARYWSNLVLTPLKDNAGDLQGFAGVIRDITEQKQAEDELHRSEAYMAEAQKLSQTGSWGWNVSTGEVYWSRESFRIFGVNPRDVKPSHQLFLQFVHPEDRAYVEQTFEKASREKSQFKIEFRIVLSDGSARHIRSLGYPVPQESGLADFAGAVIDVSEQKLAEETFRNAQAGFARVARLTIDEYAVSIAQEIGQSLDAIASNADFCFRLAEATRALPYEAREPLLNIVKDANSANELLARARQNAPSSIGYRIPLEVGDLILDVLALGSRDLRQNRITVQTELAENLPSVSGDRIELQQALLNLVVNAIEAMSEEPDERRILTIRTAQDMLDRKEAVRIEVQDRGTGFAPEEKDRLFDAFYSTKPHGVGMGLRISRSIVEEHGGRLWASANAGPGATFTCALPVADHA